MVVRFTSQSSNAPVFAHAPTLDIMLNDASDQNVVCEIAVEMGFVRRLPGPVVASNAARVLIADHIDDQPDQFSATVVLLGFRGVPPPVPDNVDDLVDLGSRVDIRRALSRAARLAEERRVQQLGNLAGHAALAAFDASATYMTLFDRNGRRLWTNDAVQRDFGGRSAGSNLFTDRAPQLNFAISSFTQRLFAESLAKPGVTVSATMDGVQTRDTNAAQPFQLDMTNLLDHPGIGVVVAMARPIVMIGAPSPAKPAVEQINFQTIVEGSPLVLFLTTGTPHEQILYCSPRVEQLLQLPVSTVIDPEFHWVDRIHPDDRERIDRALMIAEGNLEESTIEYRFLTGLGTYRWMRTVSRRDINEHGETIWIGNILDVESDHQLRAAAERRDIELQVLRQIRRMIAQEDDLNLLFEESIGLLASTFGFPMVHLYDLSDDLPQLICSAGPTHESDLPAEHPFTISRAARDGETVVYGQVTHDAAVGDSPVTRADVITSEIAVPLIDRERVPGVLVIGGTRGVPIGSGDVSLVETVSEYLSMAITRGRLQSEAKEQERTYQAVVERVREVIFHLSINLDIRYANPAWEDILGYSPEQLINRSLLDIVHPSQRATIAEQINALDYDEHGELLTETRILSNSGQLRWMELRVRCDTRADERREYSGMLVDITDRRRSDDALRESNEHFRRLAFQDPLTGLPNRLVFNDRLQHAMAGAQRRGSGVAVLFVDLDGFKPVNDLYGHSVGDRVLTVVGRRLASWIRNGDTIARFGGDEFAIILEDIADASQAMAIATGLIESMLEPLQEFDEEIVVGMSIGITYLGERSVSIEQAVAEADAALYQAKKAGRGQYAIFENQEDADTDGEYRSDLRRGIGSQELTLIYQPIVSLDERKLVALEMRIRWDHPRYGRLIPGNFLRRADANGLLDVLGEEALSMVMRDLRYWQDRGFRIPDLRITMSGRQALDSGLLWLLSGLRERRDIDSSVFGLELSYGTSSPERSAVEQLIQQLQALGIRVGLDNYLGSADSIMAIARLPFDFLNLEVDRILSAGPTERAAAVIRSVVDVANALKTPLVVKMIDDPVEVDWLRNLGVTIGQGDAIMPEMSAEQVSQLLTREG